MGQYLTDEETLLKMQRDDAEKACGARDKLKKEVIKYRALSTDAYERGYRDCNRICSEGNLAYILISFITGAFFGYFIP